MTTHECPKYWDNPSKESDDWGPEGDPPEKDNLIDTPIRGKAARLIREIVLDPPSTDGLTALAIVDTLIKKGLLPNERAEYEKKCRIGSRLLYDSVRDLARRSGVLFEELPKRYPWVKHLDRDELSEFAHDLAKAENSKDVEVLVAQWHNTADINADPVLHGILSISLPVTS